MESTPVSNSKFKFKFIFFVKAKLRLEKYTLHALQLVMLIESVWCNYIDETVNLHVRED